MIYLDPLARFRLQRGAEHLCRLGPRATAEFLGEVADRVGGMPCILDRLSEYERRLSPAMLRLTGGDHFPPRALRLVPPA
jgi:hypothetical protein